VAALSSFSPPGNLDELSEEGRAGWSERVAREFRKFDRSEFPQFLDPTVDDLSPDAATRAVTWVAFPASLLPDATSQEGRWQLADSDRDRQDEYCEWSVERNADMEITKVTFTTETPDYYMQLFETDRDLLLELYSRFADRPVEIDEIQSKAGTYRTRNELNGRTDGPIVHLIQDSNTLGAAVRLAAEATILRVNDQGPVVNQQELVICGGLGNPMRNSDPQIAAAINQFAAQGADITLADPPGLYLDGLTSAGMQTLDGTDPAEFWTVERGTDDLTLRASFAVPEELGYTVRKITLSGRPITRGAQLADRVKVKIRAVASAADHQPTPQPCVG
jgi:hypothetical protein